MWALIIVGVNMLGSPGILEIEKFNTKRECVDLLNEYRRVYPKVPAACKEQPK